MIKKLRGALVWKVSSVLSVLAVCMISTPAAAFPGANGRIIYTDTNNYPGAYQMLSMKSDGSGVTTVGAHDRTRRYPSYSADGTKLTYTAIFGSYNHIMISDADGSNPVQLTSGNSNNAFSSFSPDGTKIIYSHVATTYYEIWTMNIDGTNQAQLAAVSDNMYRATYSPSGSKIVFETSYGGGGGFEIYTMNSDGTGMTNLTSNSQHDVQPRWSPDGTKIVYAGLPANPNYLIYTMNANGSGVTALTSNGAHRDSPVYSPDGTKIAFRRGGSPSEVYTMNTDGTGEVALTSSGWADTTFDWQPRTKSPSSNKANPTLTLAGKSAELNVPSLFTDYYDGLNNASVSITNAPKYGSTSINTSTGVITYTQTSTASRSFWSNMSSLFFPKVSAATTDSYSYKICSTSSSTLCGSGTVTVVLGSSSLADAGQSGIPLSSIVALITIAVVFYLRRREVKN